MHLIDRNRIRLTKTHTKEVMYYNKSLGTFILSICMLIMKIVHWELGLGTTIYYLYIVPLDLKGFLCLLTL